MTTEVTNTSVVCRKDSCVYFDVQRSVHFGNLVLGSSLLSLKEGFTVFIELDSGEDTVGGVNGELDFLSVDLLSGHLVNVDAPSSSVDGKDLSGLSLNTTFFRSALDENGVSLSNWNGFAVILSSEFLGKRAAHHLSSQAARGTEVSLSSLSSLTGYT